MFRITLNPAINPATARAAPFAVPVSVPFAVHWVEKAEGRDLLPPCAPVLLIFLSHVRLAQAPLGDNQRGAAPHHARLRRLPGPLAFQRRALLETY